MSTLSILTPPYTFSLFSKTKQPSLFLHFHPFSQPLLFCSPKPLLSETSLHFQISYKSRKSLFSVEEAADEEEEEDEDEDDDDDEEAADEYDDVSGEISDEIAQTEDEFEIPSDPKQAPIRREEFKWQRVEKLCNEVKEFGDDMIDVDELASIYDFRIDKFQRLAIEAFLRGSSVIVSAPTSSGKTLIAEAAAVATVAKRRRIFYTTPLKALSNQKFREFRVGMASPASGLFDVDVIVLDEVHYLSDISRGTVWEEIVIYCPKEVQIICLSATVANADELAGWISEIHGKTELVTSSRRPVPLTWHFSTKTALLPLLEEKGKHMNRTY